MNIKKRATLITGGAALMAMTVAGCSPAADAQSGSEGRTTVTVRLWDEVVAAAYEESFTAFEEENPDVDVVVELVPWADYWTKMPVDFASGTMADIFWTNAANFAEYVDNGNLVNVSEELGDGDGEWVQSVVDLYTRNGSLWGVPQLWDSIALFYNKDLVAAAGVDPADLRWDPSGADDNFIQAAQSLTIDANGLHAGEEGFDPAHVEQYGFNAMYDGQAIISDFVGSNGAEWRDGDEYVFDSPEGVEAISYVVDLINTHHVAPPAADTNSNGDLPRDLFIGGKLALFQSGPYSLKPILDNTDIEWGIVPMLEGPAGRVSLVHGIIAAGNAASQHPEETLRVLEWLGSEEGQRPVAEQGASFPGVIGAQDAFLDFWDEQGVDVQPFIDAAEGVTTNNGSGLAVNAANQAIRAIMLEVMLGRLSAEDGVRQAVEAANAAVAAAG